MVKGRHMDRSLQQSREAASRAATVARTIAEEARERNDGVEAERFERIAALAEAHIREADAVAVIG